MKKFTLLFILLAFFFSPCFAELSSSNLEKMLTPTILTLMQQQQIPGVAVIIYQDGKPASYYFGYADKEKKKPISKRTIFEVGSISKILTSLLFAQDVDTEKMKFNTPLSNFLGNLNPRFAKIALQDLATHTSGLPFEIPNHIQTRTELENYLRKWSPSESSRHIEWIYSNLGIGLLGFALEAEAKTDFNQLYLSRILKPLGMNPIAFNVPKKLNRYFAKGYDEKGKAIAHKELGLLPAAYDLKVSADDMKRFLSAAIGLEGTPWTITFPMRLTQAAYIKLPDRMQGLAWQIHPLTSHTLPLLLDDTGTMDLGPIPVIEKLPNPIYNGNALIDKTGGTQGFRAYIAVIPNKKSGIVILANKQFSQSALVTAGREILFKINGFWPKIPNEAKAML